MRLLATWSLLVPQWALAQGLDQPTASSWRVTRSWTPALETRYGRFVQRIGRAVAARRCGHLNDCLNNPAINPYHKPEDRPLHFRADCADVPYVLRAYFSFRNGLPFVWTRAMVGRGGDARYLLNSHASGIRRWTDYATPRELFEGIGSEVHSGFFRIAPEADDGDTYQASINRTSIHPGTVFYDPNGHVLVVYEIMPNGEVRFFDGHPDNTISHPSFSPRQELGPAAFGGGFRNFRPFTIRGNEVRFTPNRQIRDSAGRLPFDRSRYRVRNVLVTYHEWVRARLATRQGNAAPTTRPIAAR
jgi:hypothetical protein